MPRIEKQIEIAAGGTTVFRVCHDMERRPDWDERISRAQVLTPKPIRRGTVIRFDTRPAMGNVFSWDGEVVEYQFPSMSRVRVVDVAPSSSFVGGSESWRFSSAGGTTQVTLTWDYKPRGIIGTILDLVVRRRSTSRAVQATLENLQSAIEE